MPKTDRLKEATGWIDLVIVQREETPQRLMELSIELHVGVL